MWQSSLLITESVSMNNSERKFLAYSNDSIQIISIRARGIGLAICKKIIDNHHGVIRAESVPGNGSTFTIFLPRRQQRFRVNDTHELN